MDLSELGAEDRWLGVEIPAAGAFAVRGKLG